MTATSALPLSAVPSARLTLERTPLKAAARSPGSFLHLWMLQRCCSFSSVHSVPAGTERASLLECSSGRAASLMGAVHARGSWFLLCYTE